MSSSTFRGHIMSGSVNSKLDWSDNLAAIFEAKLTLTDPQVQSPSFVFVGAVDTNFLGIYRDLMFLFSFKK